MRTALDYLIFDYSEDEEGSATWDAMATVTADRWPALQAEVLQVLHWAEQQFPRQRGALDEGAAWDFDISLGDMPLDDEIDRSPTREDEKKFARQHAKQIRKDRKGERRSRGAEAPPKKPASKKPAPKKPAVKRPAKAAPRKSR